MCSVRVKIRSSTGTAVVFTDPEEIAGFIQYRMEKHPRMIGAIMKMDGFSAKPSREELVEYSRRLALVRITRRQN